MMLRRIMIAVAALAVTFAMSASPTNAGQNHHGQLNVIDSQHNVSHLPTPQPECTSIDYVAWPPIVRPIRGVSNHTIYYVELFFADGCTGSSVVVSPATSDIGPHLDATHYLTW